MSKSWIFLVKSFLGKFYRHLATFYSSHWSSFSAHLSSLFFCLRRVRKVFDLPKLDHILWARHVHVHGGFPTSLISPSLSLSHSLSSASILPVLGHIPLQSRLQTNIRPIASPTLSLSPIFTLKHILLTWGGKYHRIFAGIFQSPGKSERTKFWCLIWNKKPFAHLLGVVCTNLYGAIDMDSMSK